MRNSSSFFVIGWFGRKRARVFLIRLCPFRFYYYVACSLRFGDNIAVKDEVLKAMKEAGKPLSAGEVEKITGIDRKEIDKAFKELKAENAIVSPVRCKWEPA